MLTSILSALAITGAVALFVFGYNTKKEIGLVDRRNAEEDRIERNSW